jgi:type IV pilus assembly protein PilM
LFEGVLGIKQATFGLDIGHATMKMVQVSGSGVTSRLHGAVEVAVPENSITKDGIKEKKKLAQIIKAAVKEAQPSPITAKIVSSALPESLVFTKLIDLPKMTDKELAKNIPYQATEFFPLPVEETYMDWQVVGTLPNNSIEVLVVAAPRILVNDLIETVKLAGFELMGLETKPIALLRALIKKSEPGPIIVMDIGATNTSMVCFDQGTLKLTSTLTFGGDQIKLEPAEHIKSLSEEVIHLIKYYQNRLGQVQVFKKIILAGGGANIHQIPIVLQQLVKIKAEVGEPLIRLKNYDPKYAASIGLAMKEITYG